MTERARSAYREAGVDVDAGEQAVELIRAHVDSTRRPEVVGGLGGFGGAFSIPEGYREPLLIASTDGVGTKTVIAAAVGRFDTIGIDLVAMCADDVVCTGAEPLAFLDYVAVGRLDPVGVAELVGSVAAGCREAGCGAGRRRDGRASGGPRGRRVRPGRLLHRRRRAIAGDRRLGGPCRRRHPRPGLDGLHANGYSLVRSLVAQWDLDLAAPYQARLRRTLGDAATDALLEAAPQELMATLGEVLLTPTKIYAKAVLAARAALGATGSTSTAPRTSPAADCPATSRGAAGRDGGAARPGRWTMPSVMRLFGALGGLDDEELRATFNGGLGMVLVVPPAAIPAAIGALAEHGVEAIVVGEVIEADSTDGVRYIEGRLESVA